MTNSPKPRTCPNTRCSSKGAGATPDLVRHSLLHTGTGTRQRWRCKRCGSTFTPRTGTPYHRLRKPAAWFDAAILMSVQGMNKAGIAAVVPASVSTVSRWISRGAAHMARFQDRVVQNVAPVELQLDELRGWGPSRADRQFVFNSLDVGSRFWLSQRVGGRTRRNCRLLVRDSRARSAFGIPRVLVVTDKFRYYRAELAKTWGSTCVHVESKKLYRGGRVVRSDHTLVLGTEWQLESARERCEDSKKINTSYVERLNLFARRSLAYLHRRTNSLPRSSRALEEAVELLRGFYNFVRPHGSLRFGTVKRTPAMQAGLVTRRLTLRDIFLASRPWARVPWIKDPKVRAEWRLACASNS